MEFDELQKIWSTQDNKPLWAFDEKALHNRILSKKRKARHITNVSEWSLIIINFGAGCFLFGVNFFSAKASIFMYLTAVWMWLTFLYVVVSRRRRIRGEHRFDRSLHGDLDYAISVTTYQFNLSMIMRWNILPIAGLTLLSMREFGKPTWAAVLILASFVLAYYVGGWEHNFYKCRRRELKILQNKLEDES